MNEISILMHMLSKHNNLHEFGATQIEIFDKLNLKGKFQKESFNKLITNLANYIEPLGLQIRFNPLDSHWYIGYKSDISELFNLNPFYGRPSLAATLFCTLACCLQNENKTQLQEIRKFRKKKNLLDDLKELKKFGYILMGPLKQEISLTPLIGYQLDLDLLFLKLAIKMKESKNNS